MKKVFTSVLVALTGICALQAQVKLTYETHGFNPGETHQAQKVEYKKPGQSGINVTWDFQELVTIKDEIDSPVAAGESSDYNIGITQGDGPFYLYNVTKEQVEYRGYRKGDFSVYFETPIIKTKYPQTYGSAFEGTFEGYLSRSGGQTGKVSGTYSTEVDATGTVLLPNHVSLPVIRVKTTKLIKEWGGQRNYAEITKYLWYAQEIRYPVFVSMETASINPSTGERYVTSLESYLNKNLDLSKQKQTVRSTTGTDQFGTGISCSVSPNPFKDQISINYTLPKESSVSIELYNVQGSKLATVLPKQLQTGSQSVSYNLGNLTDAKGVYFLTITIDGKAYNEKLIKK